jgi:CubicO group peptidase (beta-lactamase class C family)
MEYLANSQPVFPPRTEPSYSNIGFSLLGRVLANVTGQTYEEYISSSILKPLNMSQTTFTKPNESRSVIPNSSYFGVDLGVGNPYEEPTL